MNPERSMGIFLLCSILSFSYSGAEATSYPSESPSNPSLSINAEGLSLEQAVDLALRRNPLTQSAAAGRKMADASAEEALAGRWPLLQFNEIFTRSNNPVFVFGSLLEQARFGPGNFDIGTLNNPDSLNNFRTAVNLKWPLFDQMQTPTRITRARIGQEQADLQVEIVNQQIRFEVIRAYYGVLVAREKEQVAGEAVRMGEADRKRIGDLFSSGLVVQSDLLGAEVQLAEFRQQQLQAEGDWFTAQALLNTVMGLPVQTSHKIGGQLAEKDFPLPETDELLRLALEHRPDYSRAGSAIRSAEEGVRGAKGNYLPRIDVFSTYGISGRDLASGSSDYAVGAGLTFDLFDLSRGARVDKARAAKSAAAAEQEHLANQIRLEVIHSYRGYVTARERVKVAVGAVAQADEALRIVQDRYREGLTQITEVLRAETAFVRARLNLIAARYDTYVGYARILMASGRLTDVQAFIF
jgi:outer membrane protein